VGFGPFLDSGALADFLGSFRGSQRWLWDTGAQCKVLVLGSLTVFILRKRFAQRANVSYVLVSNLIGGGRLRGVLRISG